MSHSQLLVFFLLRKINLEYSLEGLMLKWKLQYSGHLMRRVDSLGKILMLGKIEGKGRRGQKRVRWLNSITSSMDMNMSKPGEIVKDRETWLVAVHGMAKNQTRLNKKFENSYLQTFFENGYPPTSISALLTMPKPLTVWITINSGKF